MPSYGHCRQCCGLFASSDCFLRSAQLKRIWPTDTSYRGTENADISDPVDRTAQAITNLIVVNTMTWADFVDETSRIEAELRRDPADIYRNMTFETRDRYRTAVERLAQRCDFSEQEVARQAFKKCRLQDAGSLRSHVGHWLIGDGFVLLETEFGCRVAPLSRLRRWLSAGRDQSYALSLVLGVFAALLVPLAYLGFHDATLLQRVSGLLISLVPASVFGVWAVHWIITKMTSPEPLPEMDFSKPPRWSLPWERLRRTPACPRRCGSGKARPNLKRRTNG